MEKLNAPRLCLKIVAFALFFGYCGLAFAAVYEGESAPGDIRFEVSSTLHEILGQAKSWRGRLNFDSSTGQSGTPFEIRVPIQSLDTAHAARDKAMLKMFDAQHYPEAVWRVESLSCPPLSEGKVSLCQARGQFLIHGRSVARQAELSLKLTGEYIEAQTVLDLTTSEFGLKPPSVLGVIRVAKQVKVFVKTKWKKRA